MVFLLHKILYETQSYHESLEIASLIADECHKLYEVFSQEKLKKLLELLKESQISLLENQEDSIVYLIYFKDKIYFFHFVVTLRISKINILHNFKINTSPSSSNTNAIFPKISFGGVLLAIVLTKKSINVFSSSPRYSIIFFVIHGLILFSIILFFSIISQSIGYSNNCFLSVGIFSIILLAFSILIFLLYSSCNEESSNCNFLFFFIL
jgi:hypothetical protein